MPGEVKLRPCPFCGGKASIEDAGCETYFISCTLCDTIVGDGGNLEKGVAKWNLRTHEPGTSVIRWTRYDGTPETLPKGRILVQRQEVGFTKEVLEFEVYFDNDNPCWKKGMTFWRMDIGDLWACLPEPPEGME